MRSLHATNEKKKETHIQIEQRSDFIFPVPRYVLRSLMQRHLNWLCTESGRFRKCNSRKVSQQQRAHTYSHTVILDEHAMHLASKYESVRLILRALHVHSAPNKFVQSYTHSLLLPSLVLPFSFSVLLPFILSSPYRVCSDTVIQNCFISHPDCTLRFSTIHRMHQNTGRRQQ